MAESDARAPNFLEDLEQVAGLLVCADLSDSRALAEIESRLSALGSGDAPSGLQAAARSAAVRLKAILDRSAPHPETDLQLVNETVTAMLEAAQDGKADSFEAPRQASAPQPPPASVSGAFKPSSLVDESLFRDFLSRQGAVLEEMEVRILALEKGAAGEDLATLRRQIHTLKGDSGLLGLNDVERLCHATEDLFDLPDIRRFADYLLEFKDWLSRLFAHLSQGAEAPGPVALILARIPSGDAPAAAAEAVSAPSAPSPAPAEALPAAGASPGGEETGPNPLDEDPELIREFIGESTENLENVDQQLLTLEHEPQDAEALNSVFRAFHTIKGVSSFMGLKDIQALAHSTENLLDQARKGEAVLAGPALDLVFESADCMKRMIQQVAAALGGDRRLVKDPGMPGLLGRLKAITQAKANPVAPPVAGPAPVVASEPPAPAAPTPPTGSAVPPPQPQAVAAKTPAPAEAVPSCAPPAAAAAPAVAAAPACAPAAAASPPAADSLPAAAANAPAANSTKGKDPEEVTASKPGRAEADSGASSGRPAAVKETLKVDAERLDRLVDMIGELVIAESMVSKSEELRGQATSKLVQHLNQLDKITRELQEMGTSLRMVPIKPIFQRMARLVRDLAKRSGKAVEFITQGEDTELDKAVVELIGDPLVHMIRNSLDHGIEPNVEDRIKAGKPATARVELRAFHRAGNIFIEIADDGRGLDRDAITAKAREKGLIGPQEDLSEGDAFKLIFAPGFSTAKQITDISGRGVGMDVVRRNIEALRGQIDIQSQRGKGATFSIRLPLTLAIIDGMVVCAGQERYIIPTLSIVRSIRPQPGEIFTVVGRGEVLSLQGQFVPLFRLGELFNIPGAKRKADEALVVIVEDNGRQAGIITDELIGQQQIVIKSLGETLHGTPGISGGAIMPDGHVGLILDVGGLVKLATSLPASPSGVLGAARNDASQALGPAREASGGNGLGGSGTGAPAGQPEGGVEATPQAQPGVRDGQGMASERRELALA